MVNLGASLGLSSALRYPPKSQLHFHGRLASMAMSAISFQPHLHRFSLIYPEEATTSTRSNTMCT